MAKLAFLLLFISPLCLSGLINIDATDEYWKLHGEGIDLYWFEAGSYSVAPVGTNQGGDYNAWNAWGDVSDCDAEGLCSRGYLNSYAFYDLTAGWDDLHVLGGRVDEETAQAFISPEMALDFTEHALFDLNSDGYMRFFIFDYPANYSDNIGGVSLLVTKVPSPSTAWLMLFGLLMLIFVRQPNPLFKPL